MDYKFPLESYPIMGSHVVIPLLINRFLYYNLYFPPPLPPFNPSNPTRFSGTHTRFPQPNHVPHLSHNLHRNSLLRRRRNSRHPVVLAPIKNNSLSMAPLLPSRNPTFGSGLLLVLHVLPLSLPPHVPYILSDIQPT